MTRMSTDLRIARASNQRYMPAGVPTATDVQRAIDILAALVALNNTTPPSITPTTVNFAQSPYTMLATDYIIEVDTTGGAVTINAQSGAARAKQVVIKDVGLLAGTNAITVAFQGAEKADNQAPYLLDSDGAAATFQPKGAAGYTVIA